MKKLILFVFILSGLSATAQKAKQDSLTAAYNAYINKIASSPDDTAVYIAVTRSAAYPGGNEKMKAFISENLRYPTQTLKWKGEIYLHVVVEKDGSLSNIKILKGAAEPYNKEAIEVVRKMPKWNPAQLNGMPKRMQYAIGVKFK